MNQLKKRQQISRSWIASISVFLLCLMVMDLLAHNEVGFTLGDYDQTKELIIDPMLEYSTIPKAPTSTTLTVLANSSVEFPITLVATVQPAIATGTVAFFDGTDSIGMAPIVNGTASLPVALPEGYQSIFTTYQGDAFFLPSTSPTVVVFIPAIGGRVVVLPSTQE